MHAGAVFIWFHATPNLGSGFWPEDAAVDAGVGPNVIGTPAGDAGHFNDWWVDI